MLNNDLKKLMTKATYDSMASVAQIEKSVINIYKKALLDIRAKLQKLYAETIDDTLPSIQRLEAMNRQIENIMAKTGIDSTNKTTKGITAIYKQQYSNYSDAINKVLPIKIQFGLLNKNAVNASVLNPYSKIKWTDLNAQQIRRSTEIVKQEIASGMIQGKSYKDVSKKVTEQLNISTSKALKIVKTETARAINEASIHSISEANDSAQRLGLKLVKIWNCSFLPNSRDAHKNLDGTEANENGEFDLNGTMVLAPCTSGNPEDDINCSCYLTTDIIGL